MAGGQHVLLSGVDDGTGGCIAGTIGGPAGPACVAITPQWGGAAMAQACFTIASQGGGNQCAGGPPGIINVLNGHVTSTGAAGLESCFYWSYQNCQPTTLNVTLAGIDSGTRHTFTLQGTPGSCSIADAAQNYTIPGPSQPPYLISCSGLTQNQFGLLFQSCGQFGNVMVPSP